MIMFISACRLDFTHLPYTMIISFYSCITCTPKTSTQGAKMAVQRRTMPALALSISQRNAETMGGVNWWYSLEPRGVSVTQASAETFVKQVGSAMFIFNFRVESKENS